MRTTSQVAELTGISTRTLQYYDEIGLLKPSKITGAGYRLYDDEALQTLQQILFFKELGFPLKEIKEILQTPDFDRIAAFKKQKELLVLKRNRTDRLIQLLSRLEKGEPCMSFQEFDLSDYIAALEDFKHNSADDVIQYFGSAENFDLVIQRVKEEEATIAKLAIQQFGSVAEFTEAMKHNLEHFSEFMETHFTEEVKAVGKQADLLYGRLTADLSEEVSSPRVQGIVHELLQVIAENCADDPPDEPIPALIDVYSSDYIKSITDKQHGKGASDYIVKALRYYSEHNAGENR